MSILKTIKGWINMFLRGKSKDVFKVESVTEEKMESFVKKCINIYKGMPEWVTKDGDVKSINFAKAICSETARLATLAIGIKIDGSAKADWLQEQMDKVYFNLRHWVEYGLAYGTVIIKPSTDGFNFFTPEQFMITEAVNGDIRGCVFFFSEKVGEDWYTRLEYHRFAENGDYLIDNKCFKGKAENDTTKAVGIEETPWKDLLESAVVAGVTKPLYGVFHTPQANNVAFDSPLSMPIFAEALEELKDLDIAYSRNATEIDESRRIVLLDSDRLFPFGRSGISEVAQLDRSFASNLMRDKMKLPKYINMVEGSSDGDAFYQEINPSINTQARLDGINALLSQIAYKVGFSNGYFVFNEHTGIQTATGVEAEQQRTIQFIKDIRDKLENCLDGVIYAMSAISDIYGTAPAGEYEVVYDFGDITYSYAEDKATWWTYVQSGKVPAWMYFVKFEGMSEDDAKAMVEEATPKASGLFPE